MFACPGFNSKTRNKSHDLTMCISVDIYEDIVEYCVQVRIIISQTKDTNGAGAKRTI